ncbi:hypothetical protein AQ611_22785 [Burkholderia singularis]|nr:hypothetical protein AQ611_22785 [Burkholderia sp. Bp7605]
MRQLLEAMRCFLELDRLMATIKAETYVLGKCVREIHPLEKLDGLASLFQYTAWLGFYRKADQWTASFTQVCKVCQNIKHIAFDDRPMFRSEAVSISNRYGRYRSSATKGRALREDVGKSHRIDRTSRVAPIG